MLGFFAAFLLVYLVGFFDIATKQGLDQFVKGMVKFLIHFLFLVAAVGYLARRGERFYWRSLAWFAAGFVANSLYGILQLLSARAGHTSTTSCSRRSPAGRARSTSTAPSTAQSIYRPNALTGDPNHLGVMLDVPLLALTPVYLRLPRGHRLKWPLAGVLAFLLLVLLATLSRSGLLGLGVGVLVLALPYRRFVLVAVAARAARRDRARARRTSSRRAGTTSRSCPLARSRRAAAPRRRTSPSTTSSRR